MNKFNIFCLFLITYIGSYVNSFAEYPKINDYRPRVYADTARLNYLKKKIKTPGDCKVTYDAFLYAYNGWWINDPQLYLLGSDSSKWTWDWSSQWSGAEAFYTAFLYKLTDDTLALKRCRFIAKQVSKIIDTCNFPKMEWYAKENLLRQMSDAGDVIFDWCYDDFPADIRKSLALSLYSMNREFMNTFIYSSSGNSYVSSHNTWNNIFCNQNALALYGADGLSQTQKDTVYQWFKDVYDKHINGFIPCWTYYRDDDGGWNWGAAYAMWSLVDQFQLFENMKIGTNKNFYNDLPWIKNSINQYIYFMQPNNVCLHLGDGETGLSGDRVIYLHAKYYNDSRSLYLANKYSSSKYTPNTNQKFAKLLYKDFENNSNIKPDWPLNWDADKVGLSVSFSSYDTSATMVSFFNSPSKRAAHEHRDNNSFTVFKYKPLLIDAGYYDTYAGTHYKNYYQRTIAHNCVCVYDSSEKYSNFGTPASNDGGQIESPALMNYKEIFLPQNQRGKRILYAENDDFTYNVADAQLSYDTNKVSLFRRKLLFIKPNRLINVDYVYLKNVGKKQRDLKWIAHFAQKPLISGALISSKIPGHIETYSGQDYSAVNGYGCVNVRTIYPEKTTTDLIGGKGYEYWVDGVNYDPINLPDSLFNTPGKYRIEVKPQTIKDSNVFMHLIEVGDTVSKPGFSGTALISNNSIGCDWRDTLYFFSAKADTNLIYHSFDNVKGNRNVNIWAFDLTAGFYEIKINGILNKIVNANNSGIIRTKVTLPVNNSLIEIIKSNVFVENEQDKSFKISPNPVNNQIYIQCDNPMVSFEIYEETGKLALNGFASKILNVSSLNKGVYFLKIYFEGGKSKVEKFVKE